MTNPTMHLWVINPNRVNYWRTACDSGMDERLREDIPDLAHDPDFDICPDCTRLA